MASHGAWHQAFIALGANLGDAQQALQDAAEAIGLIPSTHIVAGSSLYVTAPVDSSGPDYVNAVMQVNTKLHPVELLVALQSIEQAAGRERPYRNAPRTLDLDVLLYDDAVFESTLLTIPHPRMWQRAFVLVPLAEIAPDKVTASQLQAVTDQAITRLDKPLLACASHCR